MQMDGNYTTATNNTSTAAAAAAAFSSQANKAQATSTVSSASSTAKIVGRGQPHPGHLLPTLMKKRASYTEEGDGDSSHHSGSGVGSNSPVIKITAPVKNTVNLYEDDEVALDDAR